MGKSLAILLVLLVLVQAKGKSPEKIRREECEKLEVCKYDSTENCALRCMSENCYIKVYGNIPLEVGEVHKDKSKLFSDCYKQEEKDQKATKNKNLQNLT
jgi:hypothetical protein